MTRTDYSHPQKMSPGAFFIILSKTFVQSITPLTTAALISLPNSSIKKDFGIWPLLLLCLGGCLAISIVASFISYYSKQFYIKDGNLIFIHGVINRENTCVPLDRIHSLRTKMGIWYRLLDMRGIVFDTLATRKEEIELILDEHDWQQLSLMINNAEQPLNSSFPIEPSEYNPQSTLRYPTKELLLAALCQNHLKGMAVLGSLFAILFGNLSELDEDTTNGLANFLEAFFEYLINSPFRILLFLLSIYTVILLLWIGRILLKYHDMTMRDNTKFLIFTYGLFTRSSSRFMRNKICTLRIKRNSLEKKFGFSTIMLKQALNASAEKEKDNMRLYGADHSAFLLKWWLGVDYDTAPHIITSKSGKGVLFHSIFLPLMITIALILTLCHFQLYTWLIVPLLYLLFSFIEGICAMRRSMITLHPSYFIIHNGAFAEITNYIKYSSLEVIKIRQTPLTKWFHRVTLIISTSGTTFSVRSIKENEAKDILEFLLSASV